MSIQLHVANSIPEDHWLNEPGNEWFREGYKYATTQMQAIPALSKATPGEIYHAVCAIIGGAKRARIDISSIR